LSCIAGALFLLAFEPFDVPMLSIISIGYLFYLSINQPPKIVAQCFFCFALVLFSSGLHWLYISIHTVSGAPIWLTVLLIFLLSSLMALYYYLTGLLMSKIYQASQSKSLILLSIGPTLWVLMEWARGWLLSGFPWFSVGYSQINTFLSNWAPIGGIYMVSWICAISSGLLVLIYLGAKQTSTKALFMLLVLLCTSWGVGVIQWTEPKSDKLNVSLVQGAIEQEKKWLPSEFRNTLDLYKKTLQSEDQLDVVIWPEVAIPAISKNVKPYLNEISTILEKNSIQLLLLGVLTSNEANGSVRNSMMAIGSSDVVYHKRHLVPFGEYFPVPNFIRSWLKRMGLPNRDIESGASIQDMPQLNEVFIAPTICYEDIFGSEQLGYFPEANVLVNITNNAWFGKSIAAEQHFQMSRMRAIETGRYLLRSTNTGVTAIVDPHGRIQKRSEPFTFSILTGTFVPMSGVTPYTKYGDSLVLFLIILSLIFGYYWGIRRPKE
jgi:apolipoprotein N-acyltransferase